MIDAGGGLIVIDDKGECLFCKAGLFNAPKGLRGEPRPAVYDGHLFMICPRHTYMYKQRWFKGIRTTMKRMIYARDIEYAEEDVRKLQALFSDL